MSFYTAPCVMMGDEIAWELNSLRYGLAECAYFGSPIYRPAFLPYQYNYYTLPSPVCTAPWYWSNYINYYTVPPYIAPHYIMSFGTWDYGLNFYNYYTGYRSYVSYVRQWVPTPPLCTWILPAINYAASYNLLRVARAYRDPFVYTNRGYALETNRYYLSTAGYRVLAGNLRRASNNWTRRRW